jgi:hypothetical protein
MNAAQISGQEHLFGRDRQDLHADGKYLIESLAKAVKFLDFEWVTTEALADARIGSPESLARFERHESVGYVVQDMC